jgi:mono/diheme cytochrome c family protein/uncharacterized membrane protein
MNRMRVLMAIGICMSGLTAVAAGDLPSGVRAVFAAKCAACHAPDLRNPKGRFGYVMDLARVASNREMIVPFVPEESELWELIRRGEMPPEGSPSGRLTSEQKETIRAWIAAGAPAKPGAATMAAVPVEPPELETPGEATISKTLKHALGLLGRFHILVVHFPIGLLIAAVAAELFSAWRADRTPAPAVHVCVLLGAAGAVVAAALGWLHAANGFGNAMPRLLTWHAWSGAIAAIWAVGTAWFSECENRRGVRSQWFRAWLIAGAAVVALASHFGGALVHGEDFLLGG